MSGTDLARRRALALIAGGAASLLAGAGAGRALAGSAPSSADGADPDGPAPVRVEPGGSIQRAVDRAPSGGVVEVAPGHYRESVLIEKPLTLLAPGGYRETTLVADRSRFRWSGLPRERYLVGAVNVRDTSDVLIAGFTLIGALEGAWVSASRRVTLSDCMSCEHDSSGYYVWGSQECTVTRCEGADNAVGIYQGGSVDIRIARSVFHRNRGGRVPHLDDDRYPGIGVLIGNLSRGCLVAGNLLADNVDQGLATSLGVNEVRTNGNVVRGNPTGVFAGERGLRLRHDTIAGNSEWGVDAADTVDAREIWWGAVDGPGGAGPGRGDAVTAPVRYEPWRAAPAAMLPVGPRARPLGG